MVHDGQGVGQECVVNWPGREVGFRIHRHRVVDQPHSRLGPLARGGVVQSVPTDCLDQTMCRESFAANVGQRVTAQDGQHSVQHQFVPDVLFEQPAGNILWG